MATERGPLFAGVSWIQRSLAFCPVRPRTSSCLHGPFLNLSSLTGTLFPELLYGRLVPTGVRCPSSLFSKLLFVALTHWPHFFSSPLRPVRPSAAGHPTLVFFFFFRNASPKFRTRCSTLRTPYSFGAGNFERVILSIHIRDRSIFSTSQISCWLNCFSFFVQFQPPSPAFPAGDCPSVENR